MIVLAFDQPHATLIVNGEQTVVTYFARLMKFPLIDVDLEALVGQTVAIARLPDDFHYADGHGGVRRGLLGAIVGSARVEACVPIVERAPDDDVLGCVVRVAGMLVYWPGWGATEPEAPQERFITDQFPFADFTPGRTALILTDAAPCEQRCPSCQDAMPLQTGEPCPACVPAAKGPIPWQQDGPIGEWTP